MAFLVTYQHTTMSTSEPTNLPYACIHVYEYMHTMVRWEAAGTFVCYNTTSPTLNNDL